MIVKRVTVGIGIGALCAAGLAVAPAFGSPDSNAVRASHRATLAMPAAGFGTFTPAAADPRLAAAFSRGGLAGDDFRFTPAETRRASRAVTVAVRSHTLHALPTADRISPAPATTVGLAPIAYNLGVAVGWKRFAVAGDVAHVDIVGQPGSRESAQLGLTYSLNRFTGRLKGDIERPLADSVPLINEPRSYAVDLGGSYKLTHNLDLTAGVRYKTERLQQLEQFDDGRRDSQSVYVGTAFRF